ncbi:tetratricopeptide repeat protein [Hahella ganghwensis]|uniref:tetratricopeptide repeat protein n=1 Tax=Hahella ganghwensis TaxID=286420 RepID=UPI000377B1CE|nr:tetratricopeptide repeat protein [Hahella ganghwensis]
MRFSLKSLSALIFAMALSCQLHAATMKDVMEAVKAKDFEKAFESLTVLSNQGHPDANFLLGLMYERGTATEPDSKKAYELFLKAAEMGHPNAQVALAGMLKDGRGVEANLEESVKWLQKAAASGSSNAKYNLGLRYAKGEGVEKDIDKAVKLYDEAAEQNNMYGQFNLAYAYATGEGVETNMVEAMKWAILSAASGFDRAKLFVSFLNGKIEQAELDEAKDKAQTWRKDKGLSELINLPEVVTRKSEDDASAKTTAASQ